ncbi:helix-turn-helix domain-containing protein [Asanoa iriomotensis]|uniref:Helix-turn-helix domain-containing protein n=1 Tax=Asanoa iriomotensis TaxID=234613 RepID=A0ABQ4C5K9_9ACTN|nr:helix-turn-helix domain-containing protein [Asanoa iriomotensis]GIF58067.1 hypothetical protein Air01nite_41620 [Asanoa iriomotensis]
MDRQTSAPTTFYRPAEVAERLRCSVWWVKEQARRRRIPYCWIGGSYRFTEEHISEIARLFEVEPLDVSTSVPRRPQTVRPATPTNGEPVVQLNARIPRRARTSTPHAAA